MLVEIKVIGVVGLNDGLSIYSTVPLDNGARRRCFQTNESTGRCAGLVRRKA